MTPTALVQLVGEYRGVLPTGGAMLETKHDGWRALRFPGITGAVRLWTRNGHPIEGAGHILHRLARMEREAGEPMMFDGEFVVDGTLDATKHWCETRWKLGGEAGVLHVFDAVPLSAWRAGIDPTPLYQRKARLKALIEATAEPEWEWRPGSHGPEDPNAVQLVEDQWVCDAGDVLEEARRVWAAGGEGCVVKDAESPYRRCRSDAWQKVKQCNFAKWGMAA